MGSSYNEGPVVFRVMSRQWFFVPFVFVAIFILMGNALFTYSRVNSCYLLPDSHITINGSTALAPLLTDVAHDYQQKCPTSRVSVNAGNLPQGSLNGIQQVEQGSIDLGTSDVFANPTQYSDLRDYQVAVVVFAVVVNKDVDISNLTTDQIRRIYSGDITNWGELDQSRENLNVVRISRPPTSGTRATFEKYILGGVETVTGPQSLVTDTSDTVAKSVQTLSGAIGYVSLYYANKYKLKVITIDGYSPTNESLVRNGTYNFWNIEHIYARGSVSGLAQSFLTHMFSQEAKKIVNDDAYLSILDFSRDELARHIS